MNRAQRKAHARTWPIIALVLVAVSASALMVKYRVADVSNPAQQWAPR
jgi:hypothetical protein